VVACGAARAEVFAGFRQGSEAFHAYRGESLDVYAPAGAGRPGPRARDMIASVMVTAAESTGRFGNVPRRFLYAAKELDAGFVRDVQALSELATQQVLSVKAGEGGLDFAAFEEHVFGPLARGEDPSSKEVPEPVRAFLDTPGLREACLRIRSGVYAKVPAWLRWLRRPSRLGEILKEEGGQIELPLGDPRVRPFLAAGDETVPRAPADKEEEQRRS
jgi:hypothetical protein